MPDISLPLEWQQLEERLMRANGARASDWEANQVLYCLSVNPSAGRQPKKESQRWG